MARGVAGPLQLQQDLARAASRGRFSQGYNVEALYAIIDAMDNLDLKFPKIDDAKKKELAAARKLLMSE